MTREELKALVAGKTDDELRTLVRGTHLARYSLRNQALLYIQHPDPTLVAGYKDWQKQGRQVRRGEHGLAIFAPIPNRKSDDDDVSGLRGVRLAFVFDVSQTDPIDTQQENSQ